MPWGWGVGFSETAEPAAKSGVEAALHVTRHPSQKNAIMLLPKFQDVCPGMQHLMCGISHLVQGILAMAMCRETLWQCNPFVFFCLTNAELQAYNRTFINAYILMLT